MTKEKPVTIAEVAKHYGVSADELQRVIDEHLDELLYDGKAYYDPVRNAYVIDGGPS
ncbi:hypothetical protein [Nonomuraea insulae]|uniref:Uncharacterized protein n=1 Tax=Nonomuraea insulae TaxID=1616787 RepID=A0ABW1DC60_9ACTN